MFDLNRNINKIHNWKERSCNYVTVDNNLLCEKVNYHYSCTVKCSFEMTFIYLFVFIFLSVFWEDFECVIY